jgi:two-component system CheB/CheR fusion protein
MTQVLATLRSRTGHDFSLYKKSTVIRRVERRMSQHDIESAEVYARYLKEHPAEVHALFKELLINVTSFFRDPEAFEALRRDVLPKLVAGKPEGWAFRVWVAGCATGEEAYSIAILLRELMESTHVDFKAQIYATDLDDDAIAIARTGSYPPNIVQDVTPERLRRFFVKEEAGYRIRKEIREMVVFAVQNVIKDPPFTRLDLLACRNLMIYLEPELQEQLLSKFHYALRPGGVLFLSPSETTGHGSELFRPLNRKWKLFEGVPSRSPLRAAPMDMHPRADAGEPRSAAAPASKAREPNVAEWTSRALVDAFAPASVVTDLAGNIVYVHGDTGKYLRTASGHATLNVIEMARGGLQAELRAALRGASGRGVTSLRKDASIRQDGHGRMVRFTMRPLGRQGDGEGLLLLSFQDAARSPPAREVTGKGQGRSSGQHQLRELEHELAVSQELLRTTVEDQQASTEELKSMNEELQSTNEELQSTNEELETSKEELQSINEELVTVNAELQSKIEQLAGMQNDMRNLLDNVNVGTVFLDDLLAVRRFTREATKVFRLVATDVGRPLLDIKSDLESADVLAGARRVLDTLVPWEQEAGTTGGGRYLVRIQPYRTLENVIDGVVITFTDISARAIAEAEVQEARAFAESIVDTVRQPLVVLDEKMVVSTASRSFYQFFQSKPEETVGRVLFDLDGRQWDIPVLRQVLDRVLTRDESFDGVELDHEFPRVGRRRLVLSGRRIVRRSGGARTILLAMEDAGVPAR